MIDTGQDRGPLAPPEQPDSRAELTKDLLREAERRATRLQTAAEISRAATSLLDLEALLPQSVELIRTRFDLYYVGVFLLDDRREWAVLRAGTGEAGRQMLAAQHRLRYGGDSMIGQCVATSEARIALDVAEAGPRYQNPVLPATKSEMALPLISRDRVIGAMTIQSEIEHAFLDEDITVLQTMADQLANAIQNAVLFDGMNQAVRENELLYNISSSIGGAESVEDLVSVAMTVAAFLHMDTVSLSILPGGQDEDVGLTADIYEMSARSGNSALLHRADQPIDQARHRWYSKKPGEIIVVADIDDSTLSVPEATAREMRAQGHRSLVAGWLGGRGRELGILELMGAGVLKAVLERVVQIFARTLFDQVSAALDRQAMVAELNHRASYLQRAAEVSRITSSHLDRQQLLDDSTDLLLDRFSLAYVGIFLIDDSGQWAVLRSESGSDLYGTSRGSGRIPIKQGTTMPSQIGRCISQSEVATGMSVRQSERQTGAVFEAAFPLISQGQAIGAIDVQLAPGSRMSDDDVATLATLASQLANAIANAQLYAMSQENLDELRRLQQRYAMDMWDAYIERQDIVGYRYDLGELSPLVAAETGPAMPGAIPDAGLSASGSEQTETLVRQGIGGGDGAALVQALEIRGEPVGFMSFEEPDRETTWSEDQVSVLEAVREQLELALENRLLIDRSQRALREARQRESELGFLQEISALLNATNDVVASRFELFDQFQGFLPLVDLMLVGYEIDLGQLTWLGQVLPAQHHDERVDLAGSGFEWAVTNHSPVIQDDVRLASRFPEDDRLVHDGIVSYVILPLTLGYRTLGALALSSDQASAFARPGLMPILQQVASQVASAMERGSLLRVAQSSAEESRRLYEVTSDLAESSDAADILEAIAKHILDVPTRQAREMTVQAEIGLFVVDPETGAEQAWLETAAVHASSGGSMGASATSRVGERFRVSEVPLLKLLGQDQMMVCEDAATDPRLTSEARDAYLKEGMRALVMLTLSTGVGMTDRIGILQVRFSSPHSLTQEDLRLYRTVSEQAAVVLSNRQLFQESQSRITRQAVAVELANLTTSFSEREALLQTVVDFLRDRFDLYFAGVFLTDDQGQWAILQAGSGDLGERLMLMGHRLQASGTTMIGRCIQRRSRVLIADIDRATALLENPLMPDVRSAVAFPLISRGQTNGVITLQSEKRFAFTQEDLGTLELMVNQLANVIESTNLYERSQASLAETRMLYRIAQQITDARDADSVLRAAVEGISQRSEPDWVIAGLLEPRESPTSLRISASWNRDGASFPRESFPLESIPHFYEALRSDERFVTPNITQDPIADDLIQRIYTDLGLRATAAFQLSVRAQQYGTILVHSQNAREFSTAELSFYENVARQAFVALENINLVATTREQAERRDILNEVLQTASSSLERVRVLQAVAEVIARRLDMPVLVWEWTGMSALPVGVYDAGGVAVDVQDEGFQLKGPAMERINAALLDHRPTDLQFGANSQFVGLQNGFGSTLVEGYGVPLTARDAVYGVMVLGRQVNHESIDELEREFLRTAGANVGVALETASLYLDAQETAEKLKEVDELKNQFMANMSHELRTPLNSIIGFSRVMLKGIDGPLTEMQETDLGAIYDSGRHLLNLINDILDISKINAGKMDVIFETVDIKTMIQSVMSTAMGFVKDKSVKLLTDVPDTLPTIVADSRRVRQVLINLLGNAGKFTDDGFIKVSASSDDYQVIVSVEDTGIGIPPDRIHAVFEQFEQVDSSSSRRYQGTGLGVPLSREFVRMHGGDMWIQQSVLGEGTTFCFSLPIGGPDSVQENQIPLDATQGRIVLSVDDDESIITLFRRYLKRHGYRVFGLTSGDRVIEEAIRLKPYAITLDVLMPGRDGWAVIQELKSHPETREIPVIICSVLGEPDRGISMGVTDYLLKPISERALLRTLDALGEGGGEGHVLVVDDSQDDRKLLRRLLENAGYDVQEADGGAEAIKQIGGNAPSLVVLDLMMPEVDGFAVLEQLKRDQATRGIPVVVVTAKELNGDERARLQQRVEALLQKGIFDQEHLLNDVAAALNRLSA